ncbi:conserved hypothetical protein [Rhodobacteraceae bacterium KLH11]|nr:conserved hypothetical protein [Rhodobacteraceae bacterium KLH11]
MGLTVLSDRPRHLTRNKRIRWTLAGSIAGCALLIVLLDLTGATLAGITHVLRGISWPVYVLIMAAQSLIVLIAAMKWRIVLSETLGNQTIPLGAATSATATGALFGQVISIQVSVPIVRAWVARRYGISAHAAAGTSLFEQSLELLTLGLAALAGLTLVAFGTVAAIGIMLMLLVIGVPLMKPALRLMAKVVRQAGKWIKAGSAFTVLSDGLNHAANQSPAVLHKLMGLSLIRYVLIAALNVGVVWMLLPKLDPLPLFVSFPLILLVISLPFLPAGLGIAEVTWASALFVQGIDAATAAETAVSLRIVSIGGFLLAYPFLFLLGYKSQQNP